MTALHLVAHPHSRQPASGSADPRLIDLLVDSRDTMPPLTRTEALDLLIALGDATHELLEGPLGRISFPFDGNREVWECGLELSGREVLVSLYRPTPAPRVVTHERRVARSDLLGVLLQLLGDLAKLRTEAVPNPGRDRFALAAQRLRAKLTRPGLGGEAPVAARASRTAAGPRVGGLSFKADGRFKVSPPKNHDSPQVERSDLHALLVEG
ncbi:MAG TPA: hypothetical protein VNN80_07575, partial [Polyangiaceae bacterium]|nr:hypothetical protein [Polyangiaceae bacterium]